MRKFDSANSTPKTKRKRLRSITPSEIPGINGEADILRSPLSKRKKLAADRSGLSKLKVAIHVDDLRSSRERSSSPAVKLVGSRANTPDNEDSDMEVIAGGKFDEEEEEEEEESMEDDFLARELENEWG